MNLSSSCFEYGQLIPATYTCDGKNISPQLKWDSIPEETKSLVLVCEDPDAPMGTWVHWMIVNIPPEQPGLDEGGPLPDDAQEMQNHFGYRRYRGPCPPGGEHRYIFRLYALDASEIPGLTLSNYHDTLLSHTLDHAEWMGIYHH